MSTPEGKVKDRVRAVLKAHEVYYHQPVMNGMGAPSLDFICCSRGRYFGIETKAGNKVTTPRQALTAESIATAGGKVFLINETSGMDELQEWLRNDE